MSARVSPAGPSSDAPELLGAVAVAIGVVALAGWFLDIAVFRSVLPRWPAMKPNTAVGFVALGAALAASGRQRWPSFQAAALLLSGALGLASLGEHGFGVDLHIDELVHRDITNAVATTAPGRMAVATAISFVLTATALFLATRRSPRHVLVGQWIAVAALGLSLISAAGYLYGVPRLHDEGTEYLTGMPIQGCFLFGIVTLGVLWLRPDAGLARIVSTRDTGGQLARRLLPTAVLAPLTLGWLRWQAQQAGLVGTELGLALLAMSNVIVFSVLISLAARSLSHTDRRRLSAQEDLAATERVLQGFLDMAPAAMYVKDHDGRYLIVNREVEAAMGVPRKETLGRTPADFFDPDTATAMAKHDREMFETGVVTQTEGTVRVPKGEDQVRVTIRFPLLDENGTVYLVGGIATDVTAQRRAEADRDRLDIRLHQAERLDSLGHLAGGIAHDFNNLLGVILNYAALVAKEVPEGQAQEDVQNIRDAANAAVALTRQLLAFSRHENAEVETIEVSEVVSSMEQLLRRTLPENIDIRLHLESSLWSVVADRGQLDQILLDLAVNARDAMPNGGRLTIETSNVEFNEASAGEHGGVAAGRYIRLAVSDDGKGMPESVRTRVFEPFFTTKPKDNGEGTGMGLATVYGIVKHAGGDIDIYSEEGRGTTVKIYLPVGTAAPSVAGRDDRPATTTGHGRTILVVEDEDALRSAVARILEEHGYQVTQASSAEEALELLSSTGVSPALVATDVILPGRSGVDLVNEVLQLHPGAAALFMSGYTDNALDGLAISGVPTRVLEKPFGPDALLSRIGDLLDGHPEPPPPTTSDRPIHL